MATTCKGEPNHSVKETLTYFDIQSFPNELLHKILCFLPARDLTQVRLTCRRWQDLLIYYRPKTIKFIPILTDRTVSTLQTTEVTFDTIRIHRLRNSYPIPAQPTRKLATTDDQEKEPAGVTMAPALWTPMVKEFIFEHSSSFKNGQIDHMVSVTEENIVQILSLHQKSMERLIFERDSLWGINCLKSDGLVMENLTTLKIPFLVFCTYQMDGWENGIDILVELSKVRLPRLQNLVLDAYLEIEKWQALPWHFNFYKFLAHFKSTLKSLYFREVILVNDNGCFDTDASVLVEEPCPLTQDEMDQLRLDLAEMRLDEFDGTVKAELVTNGFGTLAYHLLQCQTNLRKLGLEANPVNEDRNAVPSNFFQRISQAIQRNSETLRIFQMPDCKYMDYEDRGVELSEFLILWKVLSTCPNLEQLDMAVECNSTLLTGLPFRLSPTLKKLNIFGMLHPQLLVAIVESFPKLELLKFVSVGWQQAEEDNDDEETVQGQEGNGGGGAITAFLANLRKSFSSHITQFLNNTPKLRQVGFELSQKVYDPNFLKQVPQISFHTKACPGGRILVHIVKHTVTFTSF